MKAFFILMLFALNMVYFNHAMATSNIEETMICNEEGESGKDKGADEEKDPEDDCE